MPTSPGSSPKRSSTPLLAEIPPTASPAGSLRLRRVHDSFERAEDWVDALSWLFRLSSQRVGTTGRKENWRSADIAEVRNAVARFEQARLDAVAEIVAMVLPALVDQLCATVRSWADQRRRDGELSFHDLLVIARDLLALE